MPATDPARPTSGPTDREVVAKLIGREPMGHFDVIVRRNDGSPVVLENGPFFSSGRPMPTRYWLADRQLSRSIGTLESEQGVKRAEAELSIDAIAETHAAYEAGRSQLVPDGHVGPRPSGGVGGTRKGVKCLHAHYANYLAGSPDVVGQWVENRLAERGAAFDPAVPGILSRWDDT